MKNQWIFLLSLALLANAAGADAPAPVVKFPVAQPQIIKLTPEITVKLLANSYNAGRLSDASQWIIGAQNNEDLAQVEQEFKAAKPNVTLTLRDVQTAIKGNNAVVQAQLELRDNLFNIIAQEETLHLRRDGDTWKIVPDGPETFFSAEKRGFLLNLATAIAHPDALLSRKATDVFLRNAKIIGLGWQQYQQDYEDEGDGKIKLTAATFKDELMPYIKDEAVFHCSSDEKVSFALNDNLTGMAWAEIGKLSMISIGPDGQLLFEPVELEFGDTTNQAVWNIEPDKVVLFYEGSQQKLDFRHNGYAIVCLVDGHVELVNEQQAKSLKWKL